MFVSRRRSPWFFVSMSLVLGALAGVSACKKAGGPSTYGALAPTGSADEAKQARSESRVQATAAPTPARDQAEGADGVGGAGATAGEAEQIAAPDSPEAPDRAPLRLACNDQDPTLLYLSPDDSNSMSSPAQIRGRVLGGNTSIGDIAIRPWEFMNYYSWDYPAAATRELALTTALERVPGSDPEHPRWSLQLAVSSEAMTADQRPPMNVTLVLDTSGSMSGTSIDLLRASSEAIAGSLRAGDTVSIVEWDTQNTWTLKNHRVSGPDDAKLLRTIRKVRAGGGTDLYGGLSSGYELANKTWAPQAINRLVLISDGGANAGITDLELIGLNASKGSDDGVYLVGVGVGDAQTYADELMDTVTDTGKGASVFVASEADAEQMFGARFLETMGVAARDVRVELTMPPGFDLASFSGEEYSTVAAEIEPQHLAPNDTMVFFQELETCAPQLVDDDAKIDVTVTWQDRDSHEPRSLSRAYSFAELLEPEDTAANLQLAKGEAVFAYARGLQALGRGDAPDQALAEARVAIGRARTLLPRDKDLVEIDQIVTALAR